MCLSLAAALQAGVPAPQVEDVVVTARPGASPPRLDPVGYYRRHCFEANRLTGRSAPPLDDAGWVELEPEARRDLHLSDPAATAHGLADTGHGCQLILTTETLRLNSRLLEERCTLIVIGGADHATFERRLAALWRGPGTTRHLGAPGKAAPRPIPGWRQRLWTGIPALRSKGWGAYRTREPESYVVVVDEHLFYNEAAFILGDLKVREVGRPLSVLSFAYTHRADRQRPTEKGGPAGPPSPVATRSAGDQKSR